LPKPRHVRRSLHRGWDTGPLGVVQVSPSGQTGDRLQGRTGSTCLGGSLRNRCVLRSPRPEGASQSAQPAPVRHTCERIAMPPICCGHIALSKSQRGVGLAARKRAAVTGTRPPDPTGAHGCPWGGAPPPRPRAAGRRRAPARLVGNLQKEQEGSGPAAAPG
jgi:hypothetical protein